MLRGARRRTLHLTSEGVAARQPRLASTHQATRALFNQPTVPDKPAPKTHTAQVIVRGILKPAKVHKRHLAGQLEEISQGQR